MSDSSVDRSCIRVLLIDDLRAITLPLSRLLEKRGYRAGVVNDSRLAIEAIHRFKPDVILLDINMPHVDGYEVARIVRTDSDTKRIPIISVTTRSDSDHLEQSREAGIDCHLSKPFDVDTLTTLIDRMAHFAQSR